MNTCGETNHVGHAGTAQTVKCCHCPNLISALEAYQFVWPSKATCFGLCRGCYNLLRAGHGFGAGNA